ncbi:hypothetical protein PR003_g11894 [Phytophthora rubi]|uniref:Uncharacterized protein n=1 Tax=Phytophthora rubi TaxID=129364 RepID=A0A6A4FK20_9STRA|nr:hypothetical protein PR003_g11894 [Phytophthora rubi]
MPLGEVLLRMCQADLLLRSTVLEVNKVHDQGLGRLLYKWLDALHGYWCVFLLTSWILALRSLLKYYKGV